MILAIDFDDTLCSSTDKLPGYRMGQPEPGSIVAMQRLQSQGHTLWIFTARDVQHANQKKAVADWLDYFQIPYHGITNIKRPEFEVYIDNRAMKFDTWPQVMYRLTKLQQSANVQA